MNHWGKLWDKDGHNLFLGRARQYTLSINSISTGKIYLSVGVAQPLAISVRTQKKAI
jgi:hypothetical protein